MPQLRLVLDTNGVLSALVFRAGTLVWIRTAWQSDAILPLASRDTTLELYQALSYPKFALDSHDREELMADYLPWCETVQVSPTLQVPECRDPRDRPFLQLALAGQADALVTGDGDLLTLTPAFSVPIITPAALRRRLSY